MIEFIVVGHACSVIQADTLTILCDPHFHARYSQNLFTFWPGRTVHREALPAPDLLFVSHRHRDHFDLASLTYLQRNTPVICPQDIEVIYGLQQLGFTDLNPVADWDETEIAGVRLVITASRYRVPEHGLLVITPQESLWNMVDTVVDGEMVTEVHHRLGGRRRLDMMLWPYQPLMETQVVENDDLAVPWSNYEAALAVLAAARPRYVVPYADGQVGIGCTAWLNHYRFPVSAREVRLAVERATPESAVLALGPGDRVQHEAGCLRTLAPVSWIEPAQPHPSARSFDLTAAVPPLATLDLQDLRKPTVPFSHTVSLLHTRWQRLLNNVELAPYLVSASAWDVRYEVCLEMPDAALHLLCFIPGKPTIEHRTDDVAADVQGRVMIRIPLGVLERMLDGRLHYVAAYLGGLFRCWEAVYRITESGLMRPLFFDPAQAHMAHGEDTILGPAAFLNVLVAQEPLLWQRILDYELRGDAHARAL